MQPKIFFLALTLIVWFSSAQTPLTLNVPTEIQTLASAKTTQYYFIVPEGIRTGQDYVIFDVIGTEDSAYDPDIFISNVISSIFTLIN